jgi:glycosyltransferase involved in cell wall biosynthesis
MVFKKLNAKPYDYFYSVYSVSTVGATKSLLMLLCVRLFSPKTRIVTHVHRGDLSLKAGSSTIFCCLSRLALGLSYKTALISYNQVNIYNKQKKFGVNNFVYVANSIETPSQVGNQEGDVCHYLYLSNYMKEKGVYDLLDVWKTLPGSLMLKCFGGGTPEITVCGLSNQYGSDFIKINPPILDDEKFNQIANAKALILPSWNEGAPLVILEAMSLGIPVIASDVGFIREMLGSDYPFLFEARNRQKLKRIIMEFEKLSDTARSELGESLKARFESEFSRERRVQDYLQIFK